MKQEDIIYTKEMEAQLEALKKKTDEEIDLTDPDAPEILDWSGAERGRFYRPRKQQVTIRLDMDVLAWFRKTGGYQTLINKLCRAYMKKQQRKAHK